MGAMSGGCEESKRAEPWRVLVGKCGCCMGADYSFLLVLSPWKTQGAQRSLASAQWMMKVHRCRFLASDFAQDTLFFCRDAKVSGPI